AVVTEGDCRATPGGCRRKGPAHRRAGPMREVAETCPSDPLAIAQLLDPHPQVDRRFRTSETRHRPNDRLDVAVGGPERGFAGPGRDGLEDRVRVAGDVDGVEHRSGHRWFP